MSKLQDALDRYDASVLSLPTQDQIDLFVDAARRVANPDYEAARLVWQDVFSGVGPAGYKAVSDIVDAALGITTEDGE